MELFPFQQEDVEFLKQWGRSANWSEMGSGKTAVAVRLILEIPQTFPCLIVCPSSVKFHWKDEIRKFWVGIPPTVKEYAGSRKKRQNIQDYDILVVNYELFRQDFKDYFQSKFFQFTIFDEAHRLKNPKAKVTQCAFKLQTKYIHLMTGTPITNQFDDVFSYLKLLFPSQFKNYYRFINRYGIFQYTPWGRDLVGLNPEKAPELAKILRQFSVRHKKEDIFPQLPKKTYKNLLIPLKPYQRKLYEELKKYMITELENQEVVEVSSVIAQLMRLRQLTLAPALLGESKDVSAKKDVLFDLLSDRQSAKKQTVVMTAFRSFVDYLFPRLQKQGYKVGRITGSDDTEQRVTYIRQFQNKQLDVLLCTIQAAGIGIDLSAADMLIFTDLDWSHANNQQAEDRIHRASQKNAVQIVRILAENTIDQMMLRQTLQKALFAKRAFQDQDLQQLIKILKNL